DSSSKRMILGINGIRGYKKAPAEPGLSTYAFSFFANLEFANFLLNLSIRPAVSMNFILPVKNGCDWLEISSFTSGYSLPSSHTMVSLVDTQDFVRNAKSFEKS